MAKINHFLATFAENEAEFKVNMGIMRNSMVVAKQGIIMFYKTNNANGSSAETIGITVFVGDP